MLRPAWSVTRLAIPQADKADFSGSVSERFIEHPQVGTSKGVFARGRRSQLLVIIMCQRRARSLRTDLSYAIDRTENNAPRQVFLFSGHMVDAPDRSPPRFPPDKEPLAAAAIDKLLDELGAGTTDVAISSGACGGDLLFAESCLQRRLRVEIYLPLMQEEFVKES